ncbi:hypothetical protein GCM10009634_86310 [Saccharothrix xinjiangensis]
MSPARPTLFYDKSGPPRNTKPSQLDKHRGIKHHRHGVNVQVLADPAGRLVWASPTRPGAVHDLTVARTHGLIDVLTEHEVTTFADKAYQGAGGTVRTPFKRHATRPRLSLGQKAVNRAQARIRARRTRRLAAQGLESPDQAPLLPTPGHRGHRGHRGHPRPAPHRDPPPTTMKKTRCPHHRRKGQYIGGPWGADSAGVYRGDDDGRGPPRRCYTASRSYRRCPNRLSSATPARSWSCAATTASARFGPGTS